MLGLSFLPACHNLIPSDRPLSALLRTDSSEIGVRFNGNAYHAKIGFVYVNNTTSPVSKAGCGGPGWPDLQKKVDGRWVPAYAQFELSCLTKPDFALASGATYHSFLNFLAFEPGHHEEPVLLVNSIDGVYRLRWNFRKGRDATAKSARRVETTSNEFRMVLRREAARDALAKPDSDYKRDKTWSEHVAPPLGATRCHVEHVGLVVTGTATAAFDDCRIVALRPGELFQIPVEPMTDGL